MNSVITSIEKYVTLTQKEAEVLMENSTRHTLSKNHFFLKQGEKNKKVAFVEKGSFRMFYSTDKGDEVNTEFIFEDQFITDFTSFLLKKNSDVSIIAMENSEIRILELIKLDDALLRKLSYFGKTYVQNICLPTLMDYQIIISEKPALKYKLLSEKFPEYIQKVPQKHLASYLHLRPETLSRVKRKFLDLNQL